MAPRSSPVSITHWTLVWNTKENTYLIKGTLSGLRQFLATESPLKTMKNVFYFTLKAFFVFEIFQLLFSIFDHVE